MSKSAAVILKPGREKSVHHRHPWLFSGAIARVDGAPDPGALVRVHSDDNEFLAQGYFNPHSQITVRLLAWDREEIIDDAWWRRRVEQAVVRRRPLADDVATNAYRLIYSEADNLPGLIVDRYGDYLVCQFLTAGIESLRNVIIDALWDLQKPRGILDLSDNDAREMEGLSACGGLLRGVAPDRRMTIRENNFRYLVDLASAQKTGFYLDQRRNRMHVAALAHGRRCLDCFCYSGGFTVPMAAAQAATITCIDSSETALSLLQENIRLLRDDHPQATGEILAKQGNVFDTLRKFRDQGRSFDLIVLDPPKLAASQTQAARAKRAYKDLNLLALKLLTPGGILATFSCSGAIHRADLQRVLSWAATDAGRRVQVLEQLSQSEDHPVIVSFPESEYLKGLLCRVG